MSATVCGASAAAAHAQVRTTRFFWVGLLTTARETAIVRPAGGETREREVTYPHLTNSRQVCDLRSFGPCAGAWDHPLPQRFAESLRGGYVEIKQ